MQGAIWGPCLRRDGQSVKRFWLAFARARDADGRLVHLSCQALAAALRAVQARDPGSIYDSLLERCALDVGLLACTVFPYALRPPKR